MRFIAVSTICASLVCASPGFSADPEPYPTFTFKREKAPAPGQTRKITVQVDPDTYHAYLNPEPKAEGSKTGGETAALPSVPTAKASYDWFWTQVPPGQNEEATARLRTALNTLRKGPDGATVKGPRLQHVQKIAEVEGANILKATIGTNVSPALVLAVIAVESGGKVTAESHAGAQGVMQLMPATAERFGVADSFVSADNIKGGVAYLDWLLKEFDGDAVLALAGYNAGENAVKKHKGVPPFAETRDYIPKVLAAFEVARGLCKTQPELVTDACALTLASN